MGVNKYLKHTISWFLRIAVYAILGPFACLYYLLLRCKVSYEIHKLRSKEDWIDEESVIGGQEHKSFEILGISNAEKLDFKVNRSLTYIDQLSFGSLWEFSRLASGHQRVPLVSNHALHHVLFNSVFSYGLVHEDNLLSEVEWRLPFTDLDNYTSPDGLRWEVAEITVLKSGRLNIRDRSGKIHTPACRTWPLAKAHVQAQLTYFAPGLCHGHEHYLLPTLICSAVRKRLPQTSVLRRLVDPHSRFTQYITHKTLGERTVSASRKVLSDRILRSWLTKGVVKNMDASIDQKEAKPELQRSSVLPCFEEEIAYQAFLHKYYEVFRRFVSALSPLLKADYEVLREDLSEHVPNFAEKDMVDVLSTFLWSSSVVHSCDHESYLRQWGRKYGCLAVSVPLIKPEPKSKEREVHISAITDGKLNEAFVPDCPSQINLIQQRDCVVEVYRYSSKDEPKYFRSADVCRTRCLLRTFVQYNPTNNLNMNLFDTKYGFTDPSAKSAAEVFFAELKDVNSIMKQRGEAIVKGEDFVRSVCF